MMWVTRGWWLVLLSDIRVRVVTRTRVGSENTITQLYQYHTL